MTFQDFSTVLEILFFGVPSLEVIIRTAIECASCSCHICEPKNKDNDRDKDKAAEEEKKARAAPLPLPGPSPAVWVTTGPKVAPQNSQQVNNSLLSEIDQIPSSTLLSNISLFWVVIYTVGKLYKFSPADEGGERGGVCTCEGKLSKRDLEAMFGNNR